MDNMIGKQLTSFSVRGYRQGKLVTVTENDLSGKWNVLFFYPADFTFVCPTELGDMEDYYSDFQKEANLSEKNPMISYNSADTMYIIIGNPGGIVKMTVNGAAVQVPVNPNGRTARLCVLNGKVIKEWR